MISAGFTSAVRATLTPALLATMLGVFSPSGSADTLFGLYAGASLWQPEADGTVGQSDNSFDFSSEFGGGDSDSTSIYVALEHFVPLLPNVMLRTTPVNWSGRSESATGTLGGLITLSGQVDAKLDFDMQDATLYYELLDNWVTADLGVTLRLLDGFVSARETTTGTADELELSHTIPMLYGHLRVDLPFSGLAAGIRGNGIGFEDSELLDLEAYVHLEVDLIPTLDFGIQGGIRRLSLSIDDIDDWNSDATLDGAYVGVTAHF